MLLKFSRLHIQMDIGQVANLMTECQELNKLLVNEWLISNVTEGL